MADRKQNEIILSYRKTEVRITKDAIILTIKEPGQGDSDTSQVSLDPTMSPLKDRLEQFLEMEGNFRWRIEAAVDTIRLLCKISLSLIALNTVLLLCLMI